MVREKQPARKMFKKICSLLYGKRNKRNGNKGKERRMEQNRNFYFARKTETQKTF